MMRKGMSVLAVWAGLLAGCTVPVKGGFADVQNFVGERMEHRLHWYQGTPEDAEVAERVQAMFAEELTVGSAVKIALLNNRELQAIYEELGVAQADLVQAGLLRNPVLFGQVRFPSSGSGTNRELELAFDFLDLLLLPARKNLAGLEFEAAKRRVSAAVLDLVAEVQRAFYMLQGDLQTTAMLRTIAERLTTHDISFAAVNHTTTRRQIR
jgi:cobalt-zinc-cadmium efflux system outer membrane protein